MKKIKITLIICVSLILGGCSSALVNYDNETKILSLKVNKEKNKTLKFNEPTYKANFGQCIENSYYVVEPLPKYGNIYIEHIRMNSSCYWNGLPQGYLISFLKKVYKVDDIKRISKENIYQYELSTYKVNDKFDIKIILAWGPSQNTFIVDEKGIFTEELIKELKKAY